MMMIEFCRRRAILPEKGDDAYSLVVVIYFGNDRSSCYAKRNWPAPRYVGQYIFAAIDVGDQ